MKIEYDAAHDLLNIEFLANVPIDDSVEMGWRCYRLRKRQAHRRHRGAGRKPANAAQTVGLDRPGHREIYRIRRGSRKWRDLSPKGESQS